jgi:hypothetical protein
MLTQEELKEYLHYDPETGIFTWIKSAGNGVKVNDVAGSLQNTGYLYIGIRSQLYYAHRLAWLYMYSRWPVEEIDHINGNKKDNRICNLRDVTKRKNLSNREIHRKGKLVGTTFMNSTGKWKAQIYAENRIFFIGYFSTEIDAHRAYTQKLQEIENERE